MAEELGVTREIEVDAWLSGIAQQLLHAESESVIVDSLKAFCVFLKADRCAILNFEESKFQFEYAKGYCKEGVTAYRDVYSVQDFAWGGGQLLQGKSVVLNTMEDLPPEAVGERVVMQEDGIYSAIIAPIQIRNKWRGCLDLECHFEPRHWTDADIRLVQRFGEILAIGLTRFEAEKELRISEARFKLVMEVTHDGLWDWDMVTNSVYYSSGWMGMLGYEAKGVMGTAEIWRSYMHPDDAAYIEGEVVQHLLTRKDTFEREFRMRCQDGSYRWVLSRGRSVAFDEFDKPIRAVGTHTDITERKAADESLRLATVKAAEAAKEAEEAFRVKSVFLANMSHEIRTPLTAIGGLIALLERTELDRTQRDYLNKLNISRELLLQLVNDTLDYSKMEAGKFSLHMEATDLRRLLVEVITVIKMRFIDKGLNFEVKMEADIPRWVKCDGVRLKQVLINLLFNAFKFTQEGKVSLVLNAVVKGNDIRIDFAVIDTGVGIEKSKQPHLFEAFYQADDSYARRFEGSGLGLTISSRIVEMLGGELKVKSDLGKGSHFYFSLNIELAGYPTDYVGNLDSFDFDAVVGQAETPAPIASIDKKGNAALSVLIVDDNALNREILSSLISDLGFKVDSAGDGIETVSKVMQTRYDLVVLDIMMPHMDGYETVSKIKENCKPEHQPRIIALTASRSAEIQAKCIASGMEGFLTKPLDIDVLLKEVARLFPDKLTQKREALAVDDSVLPEFKTLDQERLKSLIATKGPEEANAFLTMALTSYREDSTALIEKIKTARTQESVDDLKFNVHALGSMSSTIGAFTLTELCMCVESRLRSDSKSDVDMFLEMIDREHANIIADITAQ